MPDWDPGTETSERLDSGPVTEGSRYRLGVHIGRQVRPMEYRITVHDAPRRVVLAGAGSGVTATDDIRFEPLPSGGTRVDYRADIELSGLMGLIQPLFGSVFAKIGRDAAAGMRRALDEQAANAGTPTP